MSGDDKLNLDLNLTADTKGVSKLENVDKILENIRKSLEGIVAAAKAAGPSLDSVAGRGNRKTGGSTSAKSDTRSAKEALAIDKDALRVVKMKMRYDKESAAFKVKAAKREQADAQRSYRDKFTIATRMAAQRAKADSAAMRASKQEQADARRAFQAKLTFATRMAAQKAKADTAATRAVIAEQRATERAFKAKLGFATRMNSQRLREEASVQREIQAGIRSTERAQAQAHRRAVAAARESSRAVSQVRQGGGQVRSAAGTLVAAGGGAAAGAAYAGKRAVDALTRDGVDIDSAMNRNARLETGLSAKQANAKIGDLRKSYMPLAQKLGENTASLLNTRAEALQAGISSEIVDQAVKLSVKYSKLNDMSTSEDISNSSYGLTALGSYGKVDEKAVERFYNVRQFLAANSAASRQQLSAFSKRGMGAGAAAGMSMEDTLAFGASATAAGAEGESAARMLSSTSERLATNRLRASDMNRKPHKTMKDRAFLSLPSRYGYQNWEELEQAFNRNPAEVYQRIYAGLKNAGSAGERLEASELTFGKEFGSTHSTMAMSGSYAEMRRLARDPKANTAIDDGWSKYSEGFQHLLDVIHATIKNLGDSLGLTLKPLWADLSGWLEKLHHFDHFGDAMRGSIEGFLVGLGSKDGSLGSLLREAFGDPAQLTLDVHSIFEFARGFGAGIRSVIETIRSVFGAMRSVFGGGDSNAYGQFVGKLLGFGALLTALAPAAIVIGALSKGVLGLVQVIVGAYRLVAGAGAAAGVAGAAGGASGAAGAAAKGSGILGKLGGALGVYGLAEGANAIGALQAPSGDKKGGWLRGLVDVLDPGIGSRIFGENPTKANDAFTDFAKRTADDAERSLKLLAEGNDIAQKAADDAKVKAVDDKAKAIRDEEKKRADAVFSSIRNPAMTGSIGGTSAAEADLRSRGFSPVSPNTTPNGANGNMPQAEGAISPDQKSGGSRSWRNNNPGNIEFGPFAKSMGATGSDGRFAKFPSYEAGRRAQEKLLFESNGYRNLTLGQAIRRWAPASENNVPAYLQAMGANPNMRMSQFSTQQRSVLMDRMQAHEGWKVGTVVGGSGGSSVAGAHSKAVDSAMSLLGAGSSQAAAALGSKMTPGEWCADFVNGALKSANVKGVQSSVATSFLNWGQEVKDGAKDGDVVVTHRGRGVGQPGGHVGLSTGVSRYKNGRLQYQTVSGNHGNRVGLGWEYADQVAVRRSQQAVDSARNVLTPRLPASMTGGGEIGSGAVVDQFGNTLGQSAPTRGRLGENIPPRAGGGRGGGAGGGGINVGSVTIHVSGSGDPQAVAKAVNDHFRSAVNQRAHDIDPTAV